MTLHYGLRLHVRDILHAASVSNIEIMLTTKADRVIADGFCQVLQLECKIFSRNTFQSAFKSLLDMENSTESIGFTRQRYKKVIVMDDNPHNFLNDIVKVNSNVLAFPVGGVLTSDTLFTDKWFRTLADRLKDYQILPLQE